MSSCRCKCFEGWTDGLDKSRKCSQRFVPCEPNLCLNGGTCKRTGNLTYECICPQGMRNFLCREKGGKKSSVSFKCNMFSKKGDNLFSQVPNSQSYDTLKVFSAHMYSLRQCIFTPFAHSSCGFLNETAIYLPQIGFALGCLVVVLHLLLYCILRDQDLERKGK